MSYRTSTYVVALFAALTFTVTITFAQGAASGSTQSKPARKPTMDIMLMSKPSPPKTGENTFEVMVKDANGKPITDAEVTAMFYMARCRR